jgi:hypothetical protein
MADVRIRLTPRAARDEVGPVREDGVLLVRVRAAPVDGKANAAVRGWRPTHRSPYVGSTLTPQPGRR